jgi:hypothetical protein
MAFFSGVFSIGIIVSSLDSIIVCLVLKELRLRASARWQTIAHLCKEGRYRVEVLGEVRVVVLVCVIRLCVGGVFLFLWLGVDAEVVVLFAVFRRVGKLYKQTMEIHSPWRAIV